MLPSLLSTPTNLREIKDIRRLTQVRAVYKLKDNDCTQNKLTPSVLLK